MYRLHHRGDDYKGSKSLWNIGQNLPDCTAQHPWRQPFILVAVRTLDLTMKRFLTLSKDFYTTPRNVEHSLCHFCTKRRNMSSGVMQSVQWLRYALGDRSLNPGTGFFFLPCCVRTCTGANPASYLMGTECASAGTWSCAPAFKLCINPRHAML
jgi:hypothetical protein